MLEDTDTEVPAWRVVRVMLLRPGMMVGTVDAAVARNVGCCLRRALRACIAMYRNATLLAELAERLS